MSLTLYEQQRLENAGLVAFFGHHRAAWEIVAKETYDYLKGNFPATSTVRRDDVYKALYPIVEVDETLKNHLVAERLKQKFWIAFFTNLIIDDVWDRIT